MQNDIANTEEEEIIFNQDLNYKKLREKRRRSI